MRRPFPAAAACLRRGTPGWRARRGRQRLLPRSPAAATGPGPAGSQDSAGSGTERSGRRPVLCRQPDHGGGRAAAHPARAAAPADRRHAGGAADEPCRQRDPKVRAQGAGGGRQPGRRAGRQICALRHRRRYRPEPARHRPPHLDAVQHAGAVLPGANLRRRLLRGAEQDPGQSGAPLQPARADARLPVAGLRGAVSRHGWRRQRTAAHPPRRLPDAAPRQGARERRHFAPLARHGGDHAGSVDPHTDLGDREFGRAASGRRLHSPAVRARRRRHGAFQRADRAQSTR